MANENGWGDGASNNNIGWGQGAVNNAISWGAIHSLSAAGLTDIVGQTFQPESVAYFTAIEDAGGTLTDNVKAEFDAFVLREKDAGRWGKLKRLYPFLGGKIASAVIDAVTTNAATNNNFVDADADATIGLTGDASTKTLQLDANTDVIFSSPNDEQMGIFGSSNRSGSGYMMGTTQAGYWNAIRDIGGVLRIYNGDSSSNLIDLSPIGTVRNSLNRSSATSLYAFQDGTQSAEYTTSVSKTLPSSQMYIFGRGLTAENSGPYLGVYLAEGFTPVQQLAFEASYVTFINNITA